MLKAIIVDDNPEYRETIFEIISANTYGITIVSQAANVKEAEVEIKKHLPDLVFLDVEMPDGTGFDLLQKFKSIPFKVIFITAYQDFSTKAFKYSAIDYILKPIDEEELHDAIVRAKESIDKESLSIKFSSLLSNINSPKQPHKLILKTSERIFAVELDDIVYCEASNSYTQFYLIDGKKIVVSKTMKEYSELFPENQFIRTHHSYIINVKHFDYFIKSEEMIVMKNKSKIPVSSRKRDEIIKLIESL